jgi:hypothetical protein
VALAILVLVIGIPIGLYLLLRPRHAWWSFASWKFRDPKANEPSDAGYGLAALRGLGVIGASIILAWLAWSTESDQRAAEEKRHAETARQRAIDEYVAPQPENRDQLPFIGYTVESRQDGRRAYEVFYLKPTGLHSADVKAMAPPDRGWFNCVVQAGVNRLADPVTVSAHVSWEPTVPPAEGEAEKCNASELAQSSEIESESFALDRESALVTDSAIVDAGGKVVTPAGRANIVPRLDSPPRQ